MPRSAKAIGSGAEGDITASSTNGKKRLLLLGIVLGFLIATFWQYIVTNSMMVSYTKEIGSTITVKDTMSLSQPPKPIYDIPDQDLRRTIRKWGCDRTETPFIFVHIGKH